MGQNYQFHEHIGGLIAFNKHEDMLTIRAASPNDVTITNYARDLLVATGEGRVLLRGMQISDLNARNIQFVHTYPSVGKTVTAKPTTPLAGRSVSAAPAAQAKPMAATPAGPTSQPRMPSVPQPVRSPAAAQAAAQQAKPATPPQPFANGGWLGNRWQPSQKIPPAMERPAPRLAPQPTPPQRPQPQGAAQHEARPITSPQAALPLEPAPQPSAKPSSKTNVTVTTTATSLFDFALDSPKTEGEKSATLTTTSRTERSLGAEKKTTDIVRLTAAAPQESAQADPFILPKAARAVSETTSPIATSSAPKAEARPNGQMVYVPPEAMPDAAPLLQDTRPTPDYVPPVLAQQPAAAPTPQRPVASKPINARTVMQAFAPKPAPRNGAHHPLPQPAPQPAAAHTLPIQAATYEPAPSPARQQPIQATAFLEAADLVYADDHLALVAPDTLSIQGDDQRTSSLVAWPWRTAGLWS